MRASRFLMLLAGVALVGACHRERPSSGAATATPPPAVTKTAPAAIVAAPTPVDSAVADTGIRTDSAGRLAFPMLLAGACQGEDCGTSFPAVACDAAVLRGAASPNAAAVASIARGDTVTVRRTDLHILRPGLVVLRKSYVLDSDPSDESEGARNARTDTLRFAVGDTLYLLRYLELGAWQWWHGRASSGMEFWAGPATGGFGGATHGGDSTIAVALSQPTIAEWWLVERRGGGRGWWLRDSLERLRSISAMQHWGESCSRPQPQ